MKTLHFLLLVLFYTSIRCSQTTLQEENHFVASTPGGSHIKKVFGIPDQDSIDFIRWDLKFLSDNSYKINLHYGIGKPNTLDFEGGGQKKSYSGKYEKLTRDGRTTYSLKNLAAPLLLIQLNNNLLHVTNENNLMKGNGGWSYTINKVNPVAEDGALPYLSPLPEVNQKKMVYEGRTPCVELANQYKIKITDDCFKLKWLLTLQRDPVTMEPSNYILKRSLHRSSVITGKWKIMGDSRDKNIKIIQLDANENEKPISFMIGDSNVIFFLNTDRTLLTGNGDFSYTLNRAR